MNFNQQISLFIGLTFLLSSTFASDDEVIIKVHNYTVESQMTDGGCTEQIETILTTYCGTKSHDSDIKNDDSCSDTVNDEYTYTEDQCSTSDSFYFTLTGKNDCGITGLNIWSKYLTESCGWDNSYTLATFGSEDIDNFECGWNGPYIKDSIGGTNQVAYSLYKPCFPTSSPTPSPTAKASTLTFSICIDATANNTATDDADKIQVRLWYEEDGLTQSTEWRNLTTYSTLFNTNGVCRKFWTFNDIYAQWYLMDFSICSSDAVGITSILYWDIDTEAQKIISSFDGDSECIKENGDYILLDSGDKNYNDCRRLSVNLAYYRTGTRTDTTQADVEDNTDSIFDDESNDDDCSSYTPSIDLSGLF